MHLTYKSIASPGRQWDPSQSKLSIKASLTSRTSPSEFILPGFKLGTVGALISPGGVGKSFWVMALSAAMSNPRYASQFGLDVKQGGVVILSAEEDNDVLSERLRSQRDAFDPECTAKDIWSQTSLHSLFGIALDIFTKSCFDSIVSLSKESQAKLIVLDTLSRFHSLDENSSRDMALVIARLEELALETGASVMFLHHSSKAAGRAMQTDTPQAARGSSVLVDNARWVSFMEPMSAVQAKRYKLNDQDRAQYVRWNISKQNYGLAREDQWYVRVSGGALLAVELPGEGVSCARDSGLKESDALMVLNDSPDIVIEQGEVSVEHPAHLSARGARLHEW